VGKEHLCHERWRDIKGAESWRVEERPSSLRNKLDEAEIEKTGGWFVNGPTTEMQGKTATEPGDDSTKSGALWGKKSVGKAKTVGLQGSSRIPWGTNRWKHRAWSKEGRTVLESSTKRHPGQRPDDEPEKDRPWGGGVRDIGNAGWRKKGLTCVKKRGVRWKVGQKKKKKKRLRGGDPSQ